MLGNYYAGKLYRFKQQNREKIRSSYKKELRGPVENLEVECRQFLSVQTYQPIYLGFNLPQIIEMTERSLKGFAVLVILMEIFFALVYGFAEGFNPSLNVGPGIFGIDLAVFESQGLIASIFLIMLILIGFGLVSTYIQRASLINMSLIFIALAFSIQMYFIDSSFWISIGLNDSIKRTLGDRFNMLKLGESLHGRVVMESTMTGALACALSMVVALFGVFGKIGPFQTICICFVGNFAYTFLEGIFWRLFILDNGYCMRIFLFGSVYGLVVSAILGKRQETARHANYRSEYFSQFQALLGSIFIIILSPWLSYIDQAPDVLPIQSTLSYQQVGPLNTMYALSSSTMAAFIFSILLNRKINIHEIVFASFTGAIAFGSSSNLFGNPFPAMLIGFIAGTVSTILNHYKHLLSDKGVWDSLSLLQTFLSSSLIGAVYSAILVAIGPLSPNLSSTTAQYDLTKTVYQAGAYQLAGLALAVGTGLVAAVIAAGLSAILYSAEENDMFNDSAYIITDDEPKPQDI